MLKKNRNLFKLIDRDKPFTWIIAIIVVMLVVPLIVTLVLFYTMK